MTGNAIFWPVVVQVALTLVVYGVMSVRRMAALKAGEARVKDFRIPHDPERSATAARNIVNQFELPVLFYVGCLAFHQAGAVDLASLVLAWVFVASRIVHAWIHLTSNKVFLRRRLFIVGYVAMILMWAWFAVRLAQMGG